MLVLLVGGAVVWLLQRLVFRRVNRVVEVMTRVVGGDFNAPVVVHGEDEVGKLEQMLVVFVNTCKELEARMAEAAAPSAQAAAGDRPSAAE